MILSQIHVVYHFALPYFLNGMLKFLEGIIILTFYEKIHFDY